MKITQIFDDKQNLAREKVLPNATYNRYDICYGDDFDLYKIENKENEYFVCVHCEGKILNVSLYMRDITTECFCFLKDFLFKKYKKAQRIDVGHTLTPLPNVAPTVHWHIDLPKTQKEFDDALSVKTRYNTKWYPKKIRETFGDFEIKRFSVSEVPQEVTNEYIRLKKASHNLYYGKNYFDNCGITDFYVMYIGDKIASIAIICDTPPNVYIKNLTYNPDFAKYSVGSVIYYHVICEMIKLGREIFFLWGGTSTNYDYKRRFNATSLQTYKKSFYRSLLAKLVLKGCRMPKAILRKIRTNLLKRKKNKAKSQKKANKIHTSKLPK